MALRSDVVEAAGVRSSERRRPTRSDEPGSTLSVVCRLYLSRWTRREQYRHHYPAEISTELAPRSRQAVQVLELLEFEQSKGRESKLLIADAERRETQLEMLRGQLSEELGQKA